MILAYRLDRNKTEILDNQNKNLIKTLKNKEVFISKGEMRPGIYRIFNSKKNLSLQIIFLHNDFLKNLENISSLFYWGSKHNRIPFYFKNKILKKQNLILTCGYLTEYLLKHLPTHFTDLKFRKVSFLSLETANSYLDGHTMIEVFYSGKWILVDFSRGNLFSSNNNLLNAIEVLNAENLNTKNFRKISFDINHKHKGISSNIIEDFYSTDIGVRKFYSRVLDGIVILDNEESFFFSHKNILLSKLSNSYKKLSYNGFINKFYK